LMVIGLGVLLYFMWIKQDVWIPRLLTSNTRIRRVQSANQENYADETPTAATPQSTEQNSLPDDDDTDDTQQEQSDDVELDDDPTRAAASGQRARSQHRLHIRARRNKMSFRKDVPKKKHRHLHDETLDDEDLAQSEDAADLLSEATAATSKKHHHHHHHHHHRHRATAHDTNAKGTEPKSSGTSSADDDFVQQVKRLTQSRAPARDLGSVLYKQAAHDKKKVRKIIGEENYRLLTLQNFMSYLQQYQSTLVIVTK
jgi:hypothetical protein